MNRFGRFFCVEIMGESHGNTVGVLIDGVPAGLKITPYDFSNDIERRRSGKPGTTGRIEKDLPEIVSGVFNSKATGAPLCIMFRNKNTRSKDYNKIKLLPRPGHADFVAFKKYDGFNDYRGGGHFSGRLTLPLVAAGVIAKKIISPIKVNAKIIEAGGSFDIKSRVKIAVREKNSIGAIILCEGQNVPIGLGEPFFDSVESLISHAVFSIPGIKGIEFGSGFQSSKMTGLENNDAIIDETGKTKTNNSGGINGGITNSNNILFRVAVKPTSSIGLKQESFDFRKNKIDRLEIKGRHDACFALRVPVIVEALFAIVLADLLFIDKKIKL